MRTLVLLALTAASYGTTIYTLDIGSTADWTSVTPSVGDSTASFSGGTAGTSDNGTSFTTVNPFAAQAAANGLTPTTGMQHAVWWAGWRDRSIEHTFNTTSIASSETGVVFSLDIGNFVNDVQVFAPKVEILNASDAVVATFALTNIDTIWLPQDLQENQMLK